MKISFKLILCCLILILPASCTPSIPASTTAPTSQKAIHSPTTAPTSQKAIHPPTDTPIPTLPLPTSTSIPSVNRTTSGRLADNEIWRGEILVTGDIEVPAGITLTIEPGATIRFTARKDDRHAGGDDDMAIPERVYFPNDPPAIPSNMIVIEVQGTLIASGTADQPILFTSDSTTPSLIDWQSIALEGNASVILEYTVIEYNYWGLQLNSNQPNVSVTHNTFRHIATCGICTGYHPIHTTVVISDNTFQDCHHEGVDGHGEQNLIVRHNLFIDSVVGVVANDGSTMSIENNTFRNNRVGVSINNNSSGPTVRGNEFSGSTFFAIWLYENSNATITGNNFLQNTGNIGLGNSKLDISATNNWWGTVDDSVIRYFIQDGRDMPNLGFVEYEPFATEPFTLTTP